MSDPIKPDELHNSDPLANQTRAEDPVTTPWIADPYADDRYLVPEEPLTPAVPQEPLFPRRVLVGWALAALTFWFIISFVAPIVRESVKQSVISSLRENGVNVKVNGHPIAPPIPVIPPIPATPAVPAEPATPAQPSADAAPAASGSTQPAAKTSTPTEAKPARAAQSKR